MTQDGPMSPEVPRERLFRSATDHYVGGVAGGLAAHLRLAPWLVRIAFIVLTVLFGGLGVVVYLFLWAVTPEQEFGEISPDTPTTLRVASRCGTGSFSRGSSSSCWASASGPRSGRSSQT